MEIIFAIKKRKTGKVKSIGNTLDLLSLLVSISKTLAERIAKEKEISKENAERLVVECINDGMKTVQ